MPGKGGHGLVVGSAYEVDFELVVNSKFNPPLHPAQRDCGLCSTKGMVLVINDLPFIIEGRFKSGPPEGGSEGAARIHHLAQAIRWQHH